MSYTGEPGPIGTIPLEEANEQLHQEVIKLVEEVQRLYREKEIMQKEYEDLQLKHKATIQYVRQAIDFCRTSILINIE